MVDQVTAERRSENMRQIKSKNMRPEIIVRSIVHGLGYRYRLHRRDLPGTPDLVFGPRRKIVFVHGCFWHGHEDPSCASGKRKPKSNLDYWIPKLTRNNERDIANKSKLEGLGWSVMVVWECDTRDQNRLVERLRQFLE